MIQEVKNLAAKKGFVIYDEPYKLNIVRFRDPKPFGINIHKASKEVDPIRVDNRSKGCPEFKYVGDFSSPIPPKSATQDDTGGKKTSSEKRVRDLR
jgi:hypothetical protein